MASLCVCVRACVREPMLMLPLLLMPLMVVPVYTYAATLLLPLCLLDPQACQLAHRTLPCCHLRMTLLFRMAML